MITPAHRLAELLGSWRRDGTSHERLAVALRSLILDGRVAVDSRLPAERTLAATLGVSRATATAAYNQLRAEGYVESRRGSGSWVSLPGGHRSAPDSVVGATGLDMRIAAMPAPPALEEVFAAAAAELPRWLDHHGYDPLGLPPLRQAVADRFEQRGLPTRPEQILVTNGALQALDLAIRALRPRGRRALVELPSYPVALDALRGAGARLTPVSVSARGWDIGALETVARADRPSFAYLMPDFHNPTGLVMETGARRRAMRALHRAGSATVIDETFAELNLDAVAMPPPAASFADPRATLTIGSLSKAVWGGLRIGWIRADPALIHRLLIERARTDMASPLFEQLVATRTIERLDEILAERREVIRLRRAALTRALDDLLPAWRYLPPPGGLFLWAELPAPVSTAISLEAARRDLLLTPGPRFAAAGLLERHLRLPFTLAPEQLERAVQILADLRPAETGGPTGERLEYVA